MPRVRDPHLRAIDAIDVAVARGGGADVLQIRARVRFREADAAALFAGRHVRQETALLFFGAEAHHHVAHHGVAADHARQAQPAARNLFEDHRERGGVDARAAVLFRDVQAEQSHLLHLGDQRVRIFVAMLHGGSHRDHFVLDKLPDGPEDQLLLFVERFQACSPGMRTRERINSSISASL